MVLELSAGSSALARAAAALVLGVHITGGIVGIVFGATALAARKGSRLHRQAGNAFFVSMLIMSAIGMCVSPFLPRPNWSNLIGGGFTIYLVATSWMTVRRREGSVGPFDVGALLGALSVTAAGVGFGSAAAMNPTGSLDGTPVPAYFIFAAAAALAATGDLRMIMRGGVRGAERVARHLWRMCLALFIAAASFFLGQPQVFPAWLRGSPVLLVPELAVLGVMIFWLVRTRRVDRLKRAPAPT